MDCSTASVPEFQKKNVSSDGSCRMSSDNKHDLHMPLTWHHWKQFLNELEVWNMISN